MTLFLNALSLFFKERKEKGLAVVIALFSRCIKIETAIVRTS